MLNFLQTRPWLFGVNPHGGISVTRLAREGLIYKRDVITYLYNAFLDNAPHVTLADINKHVAQPPGMRQVILVSPPCLCHLSFALPVMFIIRCSPFAGTPACPRHLQGIQEFLPCFNMDMTVHLTRNHCMASRRPTEIIKAGGY